MDTLPVPCQRRDVARRPVLHSAGHGYAAAGALRHPGGQRLLGMHLRGLPRQQRGGRTTSVQQLKKKHNSILKSVSQAEIEEEESSQSFCVSEPQVMKCTHIGPGRL